MMCNNPNVDLVNMNAYIKLSEILSICSQDIEQKRNFGLVHDMQAVYDLHVCKWGVLIADFLTGYF